MNPIRISRNPNRLIDAVRTALRTQSKWRRRLDSVRLGERALHLGVFVEPYLGFILHGQKTIESRFSLRKFAPFQKVRRRDVILLKSASGPIRGVCEVEDVWTYVLSPGEVCEIRERFGNELCIADESFWERKAAACYATLMKIGSVERTRPIAFSKSDRRGWVVMTSRRGR